jgi:hypothetical protein
MDSIYNNLFFVILAFFSHFECKCSKIENFWKFSKKLKAKFLQVSFNLRSNLTDILKKSKKSPFLRRVGTTPWMQAGWKHICNYAASQAIEYNTVHIFRQFFVIV